MHSATRKRKIVEEGDAFGKDMWSKTATHDAVRIKKPFPLSNE